MRRGYAPFIELKNVNDHSREYEQIELHHIDGTESAGISKFAAVREMEGSIQELPMHIHRGKSAAVLFMD